MRWTIAAVGLILVYAAPVSAQKLPVKIINRQNSETEYTYVVPGHLKSNSTIDLDCSGTAIDTNCSGSAQTTGSSTPARGMSYDVRGATFSLQLPDGRVAVVNCESKIPVMGRIAASASGVGGDPETPRRRSCRMPLVDDIQAEFKGHNAKLIWPVSLDGKKVQSETYEILAILDEPKSN
jgi:hypothetical protein